jgi:hypothetical protein
MHKVCIKKIFNIIISIEQKTGGVGRREREREREREK